MNGLVLYLFTAMLLKNIYVILILYEHTNLISFESSIGLRIENKITNIQIGVCLLFCDCVI